jgi:hypothetical protein
MKERFKSSRLLNLIPTDFKNAVKVFFLAGSSPAARERPEEDSFLL